MSSVFSGPLRSLELLFQSTTPLPLPGRVSSTVSRTAGSLFPVDQVGADGMAPSFMGKAPARPLVEHVEQVVFAAVVDQPRSVTNMPLDRRVVELGTERLIVMLFDGNFFRRNIELLGILLAMPECARHEGH